MIQANASTVSARAIRRQARLALLSAGLLTLLFTPVAAFSDSEQATALPDSVRRVLERHQIPADSLSVFVQQIGERQPLLEVNADTPRNPASTIKLLTTFAALELLGPAYTWKTELFALGPVADGRLDGDLLIKGFGDPFLVTEKLWLMLRGLRLKGLREISGDLVIDDRYFEPEPGDPGEFDNQPYRAYNALPSATMVNFNAAALAFSANRAHGTVELSVDPSVANLRIDNRLKLSSERCGGYQRGISMHVQDTPGGAVLVLAGNFPAACGSYWMTRSVMRNDAFVYGVFKSLWEEVGGVLAGSFRLGNAPEQQPYFRFRSPPLGELVRAINKHSNNVMTRQLLLTMGAERFEPPGTRLKGIAAVREWLLGRGLEFPELVIDNGAGLSRNTRISARSMGRLLLSAYDSPFMAELVASMPLSAMDGTLRKRFRHADMAGKLHVKTGRLDHVFAMAGYLIAQDGRRYVLVTLHNYPDVHRGAGEQAQEALVRWLFYR